MYLVFFAYGIYRWRTERQIRIQQIALALVTIAILLAPLFWYALFVHRASAESSWADNPRFPTVSDVFHAEHSGQRSSVRRASRIVRLSKNGNGAASDTALDCASVDELARSAAGYAFCCVASYAL